MEKPIYKMQHDTKITIAVADNRFSTVLKHHELSWSQLVDKLSVTTRTQETIAEFKAMTKAKQDERKDVGGFIGGTLKGGSRKKGALAWKHVIPLDADFASQDFLEILSEKLPCAYVVHSTHKHCAENNRFRVLIPVARPIALDESQAISKRIAADIGIDYFDDSTYEPHRLMYWPSTSSDGDYVFEYQDAKILDPDEVLARYSDWTDISLWPESSRVAGERKQSATKQGDPCAKKGVVGAFCRTYTITAALDTFLSDVYEQVSDHRYTYKLGTTSSGVVVYDNDVFAYSHHSTDPIGRKLVNAFDLVRLNKFGALDEDSRASGAKLPSFSAMQEFAENDELVKDTLTKERYENIEREFAGGEVDVQKLFFNKKKFIPMYLADWFLTKYEAINLNGDLHVYDGGRYVLAEGLFRREATLVLKDEYSAFRVNESLSYIKNTIDEISPDDAVDGGGYLNFKNGLLDLDSFLFLPHTKDFKKIIQLPVNYDPNAKCPVIDEFLARMAGANALIIDEMLGNCFIPSMKYEKAFILHGEGGNGKGTVLTLIGAIFGPENTSHIALHTLTTDKFSVGGLFGKMVNIYADLPSKYVEDTSMIKLMTSGDGVTADRKFKSSISFRSRAKFIFSANALILAKDTSDGWARKWMFVPFKTKFPQNAENAKLREAMFSAGELEGFVQRGLAGLKRLETNRAFTTNVDVTELAEQYKKSNDSCYSFITEHCVLDLTAKIGKQSLYNTYRQWCYDWGIPPFSQAKFNAKLAILMPLVVEERYTGTRIWKNLKIEGLNAL